jgi:hypothetical protein
LTCSVCAPGEARPAVVEIEYLWRRHGASWGPRTRRVCASCLAVFMATGLVRVTRKRWLTTTVIHAWRCRGIGGACERPPGHDGPCMVTAT